MGPEGGDNRCPCGRCFSSRSTPHRNPPHSLKSRLWRSAPHFRGVRIQGPQPGLSGAMPAGQRPEAAWTRPRDGVSSSRCRAIRLTLAPLAETESCCGWCVRACVCAPVCACVAASTKTSCPAAVSESLTGFCAAGGLRLFLRGRSFVVSCASLF